MEIRDILHAAQYDIGYSLLLPHGDGPHTCVLIVGGSLSHDRDGQIVKDGVGSGERFALKELAQKLLEGGYAIISTWKCSGKSINAHDAGKEQTKSTTIVSRK